MNQPAPGTPVIFEAIVLAETDDIYAVRRVSYDAYYNIRRSDIRDITYLNDRNLVRIEIPYHIAQAIGVKN